MNVPQTPTEEVLKCSTIFGILTGILRGDDENHVKFIAHVSVFKSQAVIITVITCKTVQ